MYLRSLRPFAGKTPDPPKRSPFSPRPFAVQAHVSYGTSPLPASSQVQRATANVNYTIDDNAEQLVPGDAVGLGGVGGQTHSEQGVWDDAKGAILGALAVADSNVQVRFTVDTSICSLCTPWFEDTVWQELQDAATAGGSSFELVVRVGGHDVTVNGDQTIWTPEVADAPTFDRLSQYDRAVRFLNENRDNEGTLQGGALSDYVGNQSTKLQELVDTYGLDGDEIENRLDEGRTLAINGQAVRYEMPDGETMNDELDEIELFDVLASGRLNIPDFDDSEGWAAGRESWYQEMTRLFRAWMEEEIEERFDAYRIRGDNPHHR